MRTHLVLPICVSLALLALGCGDDGGEGGEDGDGLDSGDGDGDGDGLGSGDGDGDELGSGDGDGDGLGSGDGDVDGDGDGDRDAWQPAPGTTWQWQLSGTIDTALDVAMYDVDLFDTPDATLETLKADGRVVICYFSAGSREDWRDDADRFDDADVGKNLDEWPGERWIDIRSDSIRAIMADRIALAAERGCDGVEPDNVDAFDNDSGFPLSRSDQLDFNRFLARQAHDRGLSIGLKNALDLIEELEPEFDWALNEECLDYDECEESRPFIDAGKAVFHTEYVDRESQGQAKLDDVCDDPTREGFSTLVKTWDLDAWQLACP